MWGLVALVAIFVPALVALGCGGPSGVTTTGASPNAPPSAATIAESTTETVPTTSEPPATLAPPATEPSPAQTALQHMTLRQKAAQVLLLAFEGTTLLPATKELLAEAPPGGLLLLGRNVEGAEQLAALTATLQEAAAANGSGIGLLIAVDQEGGPVQRIRSGAPTLPAARVLGESSSPEEAAQLAEETALALLTLGVNVNLAPVADVVGDPDSFLYKRTYGSDPALVASFVEAVSGAFLQNGLINIVKHFPGHGSASGDTHGEAVISAASQVEFESKHLPPFEAAFTTGVEGVMVAHIVAPAYDTSRPASLSSKVIGGLLREELGFSGLVVADDLEMAAAAWNPTGQPAEMSAGDIGESAVLALEAGCDLLISSGTLARQQLILDAIVEAIETGRVSMDRLDEAVLRLLELKSRHGLLAR